MHAFIEKILMLHELYRTPELPAMYLAGSSRHLYDIVRLYRQLQLDDRELDRALFLKLRRHRVTWYKRKSAMYRSCSLNRICFIPPLGLLGPLMDDYRKLRKEVLFDRQLEFPALIGCIQQINYRINGIQWPGLQKGAVPQALPV